MSLLAFLLEAPHPPIARRWLAGEALDAQIRQDIAELHAERGFVLYVDLIRLGYSRAQVHAFRAIP